MNVPFVDLRAQYLSIKSDIDLAISNVIGDTAFIQGKYVDDFENSFAKLYGVEHCISVANGTDSLYIIMKMLGIGSGDEVITVANSWISSSETITLTGARPVFVDIDPDYFSINEQLIEKVITRKTKAILPVHLYGQACDMHMIMEIARKHNIFVIEDCAQSHFSEFDSKRVGTFGIASSFSFYPGKNLGAYGDAGCILTNNAELATKCKMFARHGALKKHHHIIEGINSRMDGLQASILLAKLPYILEWTDQRIAKAAYYSKKLSDVKSLTLPVVRPNSRHTFHLYVVRCKNRDAIASRLKEKGVEVAIHYPTALPFMEAYGYLNHRPEDFPVSYQYQSEILSLPIYPELTEEMMDYVCEVIQ